jgi:putative CRISPR-associated protein (TIGR02619 family)
MYKVKPSNLLCTVGTSLITNISRVENSTLREHIGKRNVQGTVTELLKLHPRNRICGAEINSVCSIVEGDFLSKRSKCIFLVSDSDEGRFIGEVLKTYITSNKSGICFSESEQKVIEGLCDSDINKFRNKGLKNLVEIISKEARKTGEDNLLINATGGYKAQISFAGMIGQALGISVAYMHEKFSDIIFLPPQPVSLDMGYWLQYGADFFELKQGTSKPMEDYIRRDPRFGQLIETEVIDGETVTMLSVTGLLFHETFSSDLHRRKEDLLPPSFELIPEKKKITFEKGNDGKHKGLSNYLKSLLKEKFVKSITTKYYNKDLNGKNSFKISAECRPDQIEGTFSNDGETTKFFITTTSQNELQRKACLNWLLLNLQKDCC